MPITCTRRIEFDAAHRVMEHESKCRHLHGHRYALEATFATERAVGRSPERAGKKQLDSLGRVVDFGIVKEVLGAWIDAHWDHTAILFDKDKALGKAIEDVTGQKIFYLPYNPTAENMARYLLDLICPQLFSAFGVRCTVIRLYETPNCFAEAAE